MRKIKRLEHMVKGAAFGAARWFLRKARPGQENLDPSTMKKILFLRPEKIGDMVISLPVFDGLLKSYPHLKIGLLGSPVNRVLIENDPRFAEIYLYTKSWRDIGMLRRLRRARYDCVVDMIADDSVTSLFLSQYLSAGAPRIGVAKQKHAPFYEFGFTHPDGEAEHIVDYSLRLLEPFGVDLSTVSRFAPPYVTEGSETKIKPFLDQVAKSSAGGMIGINLSAGKPNRIWPLEKYTALVNQLGQLMPETALVVTATPADRERGEALCGSVGGNVHLVPPGLNLIDICAIIRSLSLLVTPDTSLVHIARSFEIPVVGFYSHAPKNLRYWRPLDLEEGAIVSDHWDEIEGITVDQVMQRVVRLLRAAEVKPR